MRKSIILTTIAGIFIITSFIVLVSACKKATNSVKYPYGVFPDSVVNLDALNSAYDDYNTSGYQIDGVLPLIFSTNRKSSGAQFDLEQGQIDFSWDQQLGKFELKSALTADSFYKTLTDKVETSGDDFGPYRLFNSTDGYEYLILASQTIEGDLDIKYCKYLPYHYGGNSPSINGPSPVNLVNTSSDEAYLCLDQNIDTAYYISNVEGNFDICFKVRPADKNLGDWFDEAYTSYEKVDSINSTADDKCPMVYNRLMIFSSNRPGGYGGFDLYYSIFKNGKWNAPVNMGSRINSAYDEYRPLIGNFTDFSNLFMIFSSNRPGGKGGFDLYFTGISIPAE